MKWAVLSMWLTLASAALGQSPCADAPVSSIGVDALHCPGGRCVLRVGSRGAQPSFQFSVEPWVRGIDPAGPAMGVLQEGDVLVAVNGLLITSSAGGAALAQLDTGKVAQLTVRRAERLVEVRLRPRVGSSCDAPVILLGSSRLTQVLAEAARFAPDANREPLFDFTEPRQLGGGAIDAGLGFVLRCLNCELLSPGDGTDRWTISAHPTVESVSSGSVAEQAGLRRGDRVMDVNGRDVRARDGTSPLFALPLGDFTIGFNRDGRYGRAKINRRIRQVIVERNEIRIEDFERIVVRETTLGDLSRWWRYRTRGGAAPGGWIMRGDGWGQASLGVMFRTPANGMFTAVTITGRGALALREAPIVAAVIAGGAGARAGLEPNDAIVRVNGRSVVEPDGTLLLLAPEQSPLELTVLRAGRELLLTLQPLRNR